MTRQKKLTKVQKAMLMESPHVVKMTNYYVFFSSAFINKFCVEYHAGKTANAILAENGIDPKILGDSRIESLRRNYRKLWLPKHADEPVRRTVSNDIAATNKIKHEIEYLRQEVNALKKNYSCGSSTKSKTKKLTKESRCQIILDIISKPDNKLNIKWLYEVANVSRSGYYKWLETKESRDKKEERDRADFELILSAYKYRGINKGIQGIHMRLLHQNPPVRMNHKKI